jgi:hypothetical protein
MQRGQIGLPHLPQETAVETVGWLAQYMSIRVFQYSGIRVTTPCVGKHANTRIPEYPNTFLCLLLLVLIPQGGDDGGVG